MESNNRGQWGSNFGFLMASIGAAIGLGNLWAFPYKMGKGGGFAFLVLYLILVALAAVALATFVILAQAAPDFIDSILYTPEELRIINYQ